MKQLALVALACTQACALGQFQTARTLPKGMTQVTVANTYVTNSNRDVQGTTLYSFPMQLEVRHGFTEQFDVAASILLQQGLLLDAKWNLMPASSHVALALHVGAGGTVPITAQEDNPAKSWLLHLPVGLIASYTLGERLTPYLGAQYGAFWVFGREPSHLDPKLEYASRSWHGSGLIRLTGGLEVRAGERLAFLLEYSYLVAAVDDPGSFYSFVNSHLFGLALRI